MAKTTDTLIFELKVKDDASKVFDAWEKKLADLQKHYTATHNNLINTTRESVKKIDVEVYKFGDAFKKGMGNWGKDFQKMTRDWEENLGKMFSLTGVLGSAKKAFQGIVDIASWAFGKLLDVGRKALSGLAELFADTVTKAADFQEGMLGVQKTMNLSVRETKEYSIELLKLSTRLGAVDADTLASVSQTAGQLGLRGKDNILTFVEAITMIDKATNLTANVAAEKIPKILGIYQVASDEMGAATMRFGNMIAILGDNFNATESQILTVSNSIAGTAATLGMTQEQMLAVSTAIATVETRFGTAGGSFAQVMSRMTANYQTFAEALSIDSAKLKEALETNAVDALKMVVERIKEIGDSEGIIAQQQALNDLGLSGYKAGEFIKKMTMTIGKVDEALLILSDTEAVNNKLTAEMAVQMSGLNAQWGAFTMTIDNIQKLLGGPVVEAFARILKEGINPIVQGIFAWIEQSAFFNEELPRMMENLRLVFMKVLKAAEEFFKGLDWDTFFTGIHDGFLEITTYLDGIDWGAKFAEWGEALAGFWKHLTSEENKQSIDTLVQGFKDFGESLPSIADSLATVADGIETVLGFAADLGEIDLGVIADTAKETVKDFGGLAKYLNPNGVILAATDMLKNKMNDLTDATHEFAVESYLQSAFPDTTAAIIEANTAMDGLNTSVDTGTSALEKMAQNTQEHFALANNILMQTTQAYESTTGATNGLTAALGSLAAVDLSAMENLYRNLERADNIRKMKGGGTTIVGQDQEYVDAAGNQQALESMSYVEKANAEALEFARRLNETRTAVVGAQKASDTWMDSFARGAEDAAAKIAVVESRVSGFGGAVQERVTQSLGQAFRSVVSESLETVSEALRQPFAAPATAPAPALSPQQTFTTPTAPRQPSTASAGALISKPATTPPAGVDAVYGGGLSRTPSVSITLKGENIIDHSSMERFIKKITEAQRSRALRAI